METCRVTKAPNAPSQTISGAIWPANYSCDMTAHGFLKSSLSYSLTNINNVFIKYYIHTLSTLIISSVAGSEICDCYPRSGLLDIMAPS